MTTTTTGKPENPYAEAYAGFLRETQGHRLTVLHEDGVYRHLRVQAPGTRMWSWDITTWPGHLATSGDIADGHMFAREYDMLDFFASAGRGDDGYYSDGAPSIDVRYWAEKLCGGRSHDVKSFSEREFLSQVRDHLDEHEELGTEARADRDAKITLIKRIHNARGLSEEESDALFDAYAKAQKRLGVLVPAYPCSSTGDTAQQAARKAENELWSTEGLTDDEIDDLIENHRYHEIGDESFPAEDPREQIEEILAEARGHGYSSESAHAWLQEQEDLFGSDTWEWDMREYDIHFLFTCYAIALTVRLYHEHVQRAGSNDTYVLVREGRVDNRPSQPVIDLSFLDYGTLAEQAAEAASARELIMATPQAREDLPETIRELTELILDLGDEAARKRLDIALDAEARTREHAANRAEIQERTRQRLAARDAARVA